MKYYRARYANEQQMNPVSSQKLYSVHLIESSCIKLLLKENDRNVCQTYITSIEKQP